MAMTINSYENILLQSNHLKKHTHTDERMHAHTHTHKHIHTPLHILLLQPNKRKTPETERNKYRISDNISSPYITSIKTFC